MLFSTKTKGFFVDRNEHSWFLAKTSAQSGPMVIEKLAEIPVGDQQTLAQVIQEFSGNRSAGGYLHAVCAINPTRRLLRRASADLKRAKDATYFNEICIQQFRIEPDKYSIAVLSNSLGTLQEVGSVSEKELLFCGMPLEDLNAAQDELLANGIYPTRLELGSVASLGACNNYLSFIKEKAPVLLLEIGNDTTHSSIVSAGAVEACRPHPFGIEGMIPIVQKKLGLKDEASAKKLFYSNTFDFASMGAELLQRLLKELQSSIGFFEVQTGQSIGQVTCLVLPEKLGWINASMSTALGIVPLKMDLVPWLSSHRITLSEQAAAKAPDARWFGLLSLMISHQTLAPNEPATAKKA